MKRKKTFILMFGFLTTSTIAMNTPRQKTINCLVSDLQKNTTANWNVYFLYSKNTHSNQELFTLSFLRQSLRSTLFERKPNTKTPCITRHIVMLKATKEKESELKIQGLKRVDNYYLTEKQLAIFTSPLTSYPLKKKIETDFKKKVAIFLKNLRMMAENSNEKDFSIETETWTPYNQMKHYFKSANH